MKQFYWEKKGHIFNVSGEFGWMNTHAQIPTVLDMGDYLRIFFSTRFENNQSKIACLDVSTKNPKNILNLSELEVIENGKIGTFDEHGVMPSGVVLQSDKSIFLYYSGWSRRTSVPYSNLAGVVVADKSNARAFKRIGNGPILSLNLQEGFSATSPYVFVEDGLYYAYYCSGTGWHNVDEKYEHVYNIKMATSADGIEWEQSGKVCIEQRDPMEAITRPTVIELDGIYHMWFCYRNSKDFRDGEGSYRIGYAFSQDKFNWTRSDELAGIDVGTDGWENKMMAYPYVIKTSLGETLMFYNGNGFGKTGFGYAILRDSGTDPIT